MGCIQESVSSRAYAGVSVVNAIPSWYGSSMAVNLEVEARVSYGRRSGNESQLVTEILRYYEEKYGSSFVAEVISPLPQGSGLKSSSAVSVAIIDALNKLVGANEDPPKLSAILSLKAGVSVTGAIDDASASYYGGISFTYNKENKILRIVSPPSGIVLVLKLKGGRSPVNVGLLRKYEVLFRDIFELALQGDLFRAMRMNGFLVAEILGYDTSLLERAMKKGALAAGISGNGPSSFAVCKEGEEGPVLELFGEDTRVVLPVESRYI